MCYSSQQFSFKLDLWPPFKQIAIWMLPSLYYFGLLLAVLGVISSGVSHKAAVIALTNYDARWSGCFFFKLPPMGNLKPAPSFSRKRFPACCYLFCFLGLFAPWFVARFILGFASYSSVISTRTEINYRTISWPRVQSRVSSDKHT